MIRKLLAYFIMAFMLGSTVYAGVIQLGTNVSGGGGGADYVPATVTIVNGDEAAGTSVKVGIYDSGGSLLGSSDVITVTANSQCSASISGISALTPTANYKVGFINNGYINYGYIGGSEDLYSQSATYPTCPSTLSGSVLYSSVGKFCVQVKNASGQVLLGTSFTSPAYYAFDTGLLYYEPVGFTCNTL